MCVATSREGWRRRCFYQQGWLRAAVAAAAVLRCCGAAVLLTGTLDTKERCFFHNKHIPPTYSQYQDIHITILFNNIATLPPSKPSSDRHSVTKQTLEI